MVWGRSGGCGVALMQRRNLSTTPRKQRKSGQLVEDIQCFRCFVSLGLGLGLGGKNRTKTQHPKTKKYKKIRKSKQTAKNRKSTRTNSTNPSTQQKEKRIKKVRLGNEGRGGVVLYTTTPRASDSKVAK